MKKQNFNQDWYFHAENRETVKVELPHDAMFTMGRRADAPSGSAGAYFLTSSYTYEKDFACKAKYAYLVFDGVYKNAEIELNGTKIASHDYGYTPFAVKLEDLKEENHLTVKCENADQPDSRWYSGAGIYRDVVLYTADDEHIPPFGLKIDTLDAFNGRIRVRTAHTGGEVKVTVYDQDKEVAKAEGDDVTIVIPEVKLWNAEQPHLYACLAEVVKDGKTVDSVYENFGVREVKCSTKGFFVNGESVLLKGGCIHADNGILGAAAPYEAEYRRVKLLKDAGFNAIRSAHNPTSENLLKACDEIGMYVMDETWDMWYSHKTKYDYASKWEQNHLNDIQEMVERDYNHPSVILYSIGNEVSEPGQQRGIEDTKEMTDLLHKLDPNRLVTIGANLMIIANAAKGKGIYDGEGGGGASTPGATGGMNSTMFNLIASFVGPGMNKSANSKQADQITKPALNTVDIAGYNYASGRYNMEAKENPNRVIFGSETMPYTLAENWKMVEELPYLTGDFMWTAIDYIGETGIGAWTYGKNEGGFAKKYPFWAGGAGAFDIIGTPNAEAYWASAVWHALQQPAITIRPLNHANKVTKAVWRGTDGLASYSWKGCEGKKAFCEVFYDCERVELLLNGKKIGSAKVKDKRAVFKFRYQPGTLTAVACGIGGKEIGRSELTSAKSDLEVKLVPEKSEVKKDELLFVRVSIADHNGITESNADEELTVKVTGGTLKAFGNGDPAKLGDVISGKYSTFYGEALLVVKASEAGTLKIEVNGAKIHGETSVTVK